MRTGQHVTLHSLVGRPELNGRHGVVSGLAGDRYAVSVAGEQKALSLKRQNLQVFRAPPEEMPESAIEAACARFALGQLLPGDHVCGPTGAQGTLLSVGADGMAHIILCDTENVEECLVRDVKPLLPTGRHLAAPELVRQTIEIGRFTESVAVRAEGSWQRGGGRVVRGGLERDGVHWQLHVGTTQRVPACVRVVRVDLDLHGMDQGWVRRRGLHAIQSLRLHALHTP